jgi:short-subunit dehydrogenase involved in D-alanine esterification of teichoic acids
MMHTIIITGANNGIGLAMTNALDEVRDAIAHTIGLGPLVSVWEMR